MQSENIKIQKLFLVRLIISVGDVMVPTICSYTSKKIASNSANKIPNRAENMDIDIQFQWHWTKNNNIR